MRSLTRRNILVILLLPALLLTLQPLSLVLAKAHLLPVKPFAGINLLLTTAAPTHCNSTNPSSSGRFQSGIDSTMLAFLTKLSHANLSLVNLPISKFFLYLVLISIGIPPIYRLFKPPR